MAQKTKIKKDFLGLYVIAGGWIARPFYGTIFKEGDIVKSHHFGGSTNAGVTILNQNFKRRNGRYEVWCTTGIGSDDYLNKRVNHKVGSLFGTYTTFEEYLEYMTNWYERNQFNHLAKEINQNFALEFNKNDI